MRELDISHTERFCVYNEQQNKCYNDTCGLQNTSALLWWFHMTSYEIAMNPWDSTSPLSKYNENSERKNLEILCKLFNEKWMKPYQTV